MRKRVVTSVFNPIEFQRADPEALAKFDPRTKVCTMNCGPHRDDPRGNKERKFLCDDCETREVSNAELSGSTPRTEDAK